MKKLTIIGGGPAGYAAALYASNFELEITLIESDTLGGTCLNRGCIPAKYWLHVAELNHEIDNSKDFGIEITGKNIDWKATAQKRLDTVNKLVGGIGMLLKSKKVNVIEGWGTIKDSNKVIVKTSEGKEEEVSTDYILLATGSKPREIPNINVDGEFVITSDTALSWEEPPKKVCVIGAGAIGCEFASLLNDLGSEVTVVELDKEILPGLDKRTSGELRKQLSSRGVDFKLSTSVTNISDKVVNFSDDTSDSFDCVLVAVGRAPLTENIGLEEIGVNVNKGFVEVDLKTMQTGVENIYALGDIVYDTPQLAHVAFAEAISAITHIATGEISPVNYKAIPYVVYTRPELAEVGLNSEKAKEIGIKLNQAQHSFAGIGRALLQNQNKGIVKVYSEEDGPIVGASVCGPAAGEMIHELMYMVGWEALPSEASEFIHAHPTLSEAIGESLLSLNGRGYINMKIEKITRKGYSSTLSKEQLWDVYKSMKTQRLLEDRLLKMYKGGQLSGAVYPGIGQEASMAGIAAGMADTDIFGGTHRDLGVQIKKGVTLKEIALNFFGKHDGPSKGRDGNSHFGVVDKGTLMVVSPLPDSAPVAVGWALASQQSGSGVVAVANCGEGATATGTWHESINMAGVLNLPVVFTVQNNQFAYSSPNETEFGTPNVADRAAGYGIPAKIIDGNDIYEVIDVMHEACENARNGNGPSLIELVTFRHHGHAGHDPAEYVNDEVREFWMKRDPIARFEDSLVEEGLFTTEQFVSLNEELDAEIKETLDWAKNQKDPEPQNEVPDMFAERTKPAIQNDGSSIETMNFIEAITNGLDELMEDDENVFMMGEDIGVFEGAFKATKGLFNKYGPFRVIDTSISEGGFTGAAVGAALAGKKPIVELQFYDFVYPALDQITTEAAKYHWKAGKAVPMVVRGPTGAGTRSGPFHSISPESLLAHHPGIKVVAPSNPYDAKGLLVAAVNDPNPVMYLEHKKLYRKPDIKMEVPLGLYEVEIGKGKIVKEGSDLTIVTWSGMVSVATEAAKQLESDGINVEIVDIRTIVPLDEEIILTSVEKTSNLCILQEDVPFSSVASEISSVVAEKGFWNLDNPIVKVTPPNTHIPFAPVLEDAFIPSVEKVVKAVKELQ